MEEEQLKDDCATAQPTPTPPSQLKRPNQALYVPKQRLQTSKDKPQAQGEVKPRPRPRYTDKARKNAKNRKDKAGGAEKAASVGGGDEDGAQNNDVQSHVKEEQLQDAEVNGQSGLNKSEEEASSLLKQDDEEEEEESWDTLFNDDGDCLDPHLLEEVRTRCGFWCHSTCFEIRIYLVSNTFTCLARNAVYRWVTVQRHHKGGVHN